MAGTDDIVARLNKLCSPSAEVMSDCERLTALIRAGQEAAAALTDRAEKIERLEERCAAYKGQVEAGAAEIERLEKALRTVQNAAKTIASSHGTELEHLRQNYAFDHKLRAEVESLREANSILTDQTDAAEARATTADRDLTEARDALAMTESRLRDAVGAANDAGERAFALKQEVSEARAEVERLRALLRRYRTETPLGHQPHMIAGEVDAELAKGGADAET